MAGGFDDILETGTELNTVGDVSLAPGSDDDQDDSVEDGADLVDLSKLGPLLDRKEPSACKLALRMWANQDKPMNKRKERWRAYRLWRWGATGVQLRRTDYNRNEFTVWAPPGGARTPPGVNKASRLCRRMKCQVFVDPPTPEAEPAGDTDTDRSAAEFTTRVLQDVGSESGINFLETARRAFDWASTYGSGFRVWDWDPMASGHRPLQVMACPTAVDANQPEIDPATGQEYTGDFVLRYIAQDGKTLTDDGSKAALQWVGGLKSQVRHGHHVRFLPQAVNGIADSQGVMIGTFEPLADLKARYPQTIGQMAPEDLKKLANFHPERYKDLLPSWVSDITNINDSVSASPLTDSTLIFQLRIVFKSHALYPKGCNFVLLGDETIAERGPWSFVNSDGVEEMLDIPVDQFKQFEDGDDDPYGRGLIAMLGEMNEVRNMQTGSWIEYLERFNNRKGFIPTTSPLQAKQMLLQTGAYIPVPPGQEPTYEQIPDYPKASTDFFEMITEEMNDESGLQQAGQGIESPDVKSGIHAAIIRDQVATGISDLAQHTWDGCTRGWRIMAQLIRAFATKPQKIKWVGEDGSYKTKEWVGADLGSTRNIVIAKGSGTLMSPAGRALIAQELSEAGLIDPNQYKRLTIGQVGGLLDIQDDPHLLRVRRQLSRWKEGPSAELKQQSAAIQPQIQAATQALQQWQQITQQAQASGMQPPPQPQPPPPDPMAVYAGQIFTRIPVDVEPDVAKTRWIELSRELAGTAFSSQPPPWQQALLSEYDQMRQAAGVYTLAEQQQAQAQQLSAQQALKEIPSVALKGTVDATNVAATEAAAMAGYHQSVAQPTQAPQQGSGQGQQQKQGQQPQQPKPNGKPAPAIGGDTPQGTSARQPVGVTA